jgi:hypothetical protein
MRDARSRSTLSMWVVVLLLAAMGAAGAAEGESAPAEGTPDRSQIWGSWQVVPWDGQQAVGSPWADVLNRPLDLSRRGKAGERHRYQIKRVNLTVDREGKVVSRMVAEAQLLRTLVREAEPGIWVEQCEWERFATGMGMGPNDYPTPQDVPGAQGISYEFSPRTFDYVNPPAEFSRIEHEATGYMLKVLTMDAMGWDAVGLSVRDESGGTVHIGDMWRHTEWEPWDITSVTGEGTVGQYHAGEMQIGIAGLTRVDGEPCVLIWFSMEGNVVTQNMDTPQVALDMRSTEYFRGEIAVSLLDGRVVAMEIWGPLPCVMKIGVGGQPATEQPIGAIIQQVSMWEVPAEPGGETAAP